MPDWVEKVTAFITRPAAGGPELLLFRHPTAGIQIPAGTVEAGEAPEAAVLREAFEETGLADGLVIRACLGVQTDRLAEGRRLVCAATRVYARPDRSSLDWAQLRPGYEVTVLRQADGFTQVTYEEYDRAADPRYLSMAITGWVPDETLAALRRRHFYHLEFSGQSESTWTTYTDGHQFTLFWARLSALPEIIHPQDEWLRYLPAGLLAPMDPGESERSLEERRE
jgi:8-oxo-dGTP pyrophosphatase MutT (NUDIX family)